ncbi:MAG: SH3 domain-containing protein [Chloroflexota bacterium]
MSKRYSLLYTVILSAVFMVSAFGYTVVRADDTNAWTVNRNNLRAGPGAQYAVLTTLQPSTPVVLQARTANEGWLLIRVQGSAVRGWVAGILLKLAPAVRLRSLPISTEVIPGGSNPAAAQPDNSPANNTDNPSGVGDLSTDKPVFGQNLLPMPKNLPTGAINLPILPAISGSVRSAMRAVYEKGKSLGNNPRVFSKVGDCHTDHPLFFNIIGDNNYNLGSYGNLQEVINNFSVAPRPNSGNSFNMQSMAAHSAFSSGAVLDSQWSNPTLCKVNDDETPLRCEYRLNKPAVAIIMFGVVDVLVMQPQQFNNYMRYIVKDTMDQGIIPILSTAGENASNPALAREFNQIVVAIARDKHVPIINLEAALEKLPNKGLDPDGIHLSRTADLKQAAVFNDGNLQTGYTMRNLVTLQALDIVWRQIMN